MSRTYPFTQAQFEHAAQAWGANCGPGALAFALEADLEAVRRAIPDFESKGYTSPTMMKQGLLNLGRSWDSAPSVPTEMFRDKIAIVRVQWTGPWTAPGMNPRWAYNYTHWIAAWFEQPDQEFVFDVNGGIQTFGAWQAEIVPLITGQIKRADGGWKPTHIWRLGE